MLSRYWFIVASRCVFSSPVRTASARIDTPATNAPATSQNTTTPTPVSASCSSATGTSPCQASFCSWSARSRGNDTRTQITTSDTSATFRIVQIQPIDSGPGPLQPPRNSTVVSPASTTIPAYSASRNIANRSPVYSVYGPKMTSESATGMSNGGRCSSASPAMKNTSSPGSCQSNHQGFQAAAIPLRLSVPAATATLAADSTNGSS